jgi:hypothetical protein
MERRFIGKALGALYTEGWRCHAWKCWGLRGKFKIQGGGPEDLRKEGLERTDVRCYDFGEGA